MGFRKRLVEDYKKDGYAIGNVLSSKVSMGGLMCGSGENNGKRMDAADAIWRKALIKRQRIDPRTT
ncbi:MAG TPA: hypothetical protein DCS60_05980 [Opitutae bacterium]|nr:hypothetical protein [Opitutae bacterium]